MLRLIFALALICSGAMAQDARYDVEVSFNWQGAPEDGHPADKHWSRLIAVAHSGRYSLFADGNTASSGLALVATNGRVNVLEAELSEARRRNRAGEPLVLDGIAGVGQFSFEVAVTERLSRVSFATMLAPSPDWFSGATGVLRDDAGWIDRLELPLWVWDAGADSGTDFSSTNAPTQPRESIRLLTHPAFLKPDGLRPIGQVVFMRLE